MFRAHKLLRRTPLLVSTAVRHTGPPAPMTRQARSFTLLPGASRLSPFKRTLLYWTLGTTSAATLGYWLMKDELEALDNEKPPPELQLAANKQHKGYAVVDLPATGKERLVVLGSGWGAVSLLKTLQADLYDVISISPHNYFVFTPLLPSVTVGTVEFRSVMEPIRRILKRTRGRYIEAGAVDVDFEAKMVLVEKQGQFMWVPYDRLVVGVGAQSVTHGIDGLQHCHQLKSVSDARSIRQHIMANFEKAVLPTTSLEEKRRLLTFVVCGGGPTGCEFAAELYDLLVEDLVHYFPETIQDLVNVVIVQSRDHILNMMDQKVSEFAEDTFSRRNMRVITNSRVARITESSIVYTSKDLEGNVTEHEVPQGFVLWSTGLSLTPFTRLICDRLADSQKNRHAITVDDHLRVKGISDGSVYALGDCATVEMPHLLEHIQELFDSVEHTNTGEITRDEFEVFIHSTARKYPLAAGHLKKLGAHFDDFDTDGNGVICLSEFKNMLVHVDRSLTALPALAQVADQEGAYLGRSLSILAKTFAEMSDNADSSVHDKVALENQAIQPFNYHHHGTLAYLGRAAAADFGGGYTYRGSNLAAKYLWRSTYWSMQVSLRTRLMLAMDWTRELLFGRDISRF